MYYSDTIVADVVTYLILSIYILTIVIPSLILNGVIVIAFMKTKTLYTPSNVLAVHICFVGLIVTIFYSPITIVSFLEVMQSCSCLILYYHWFIGHVFHFTLYPLNILLLTISYYIILKYSSKALTFTKVYVSLFIIWCISIIVHIPIPFLTSVDIFTECCESVCINETEICNGTFSEVFTPHTFNAAGRIYYNIRVELFIILPSIIVLIASAAAFYTYRMKVMKSQFELRIRMILLPILMFFSVAVFILGQDVVNWQPSQVNDSSLPGIFVFILMGMIKDSSGVYFAVLILYFNVNIRRACLSLIGRLALKRKVDDPTPSTLTRARDTSTLSIPTIHNE